MTFFGGHTRPMSAGIETAARAQCGPGGRGRSTAFGRRNAQRRREYRGRAVVVTERPVPAAVWRKSGGAVSGGGENSVEGFGRFMMFDRARPGDRGRFRGFRSDRGSGRGVYQHSSGVRAAFWSECYRDTSGRCVPADALALPILSMRPSPAVATCRNVSILSKGGEGSKRGRCPE